MILGQIQSFDGFYRAVSITVSSILKIPRSKFIRTKAEVRKKKGTSFACCGQKFRNIFSRAVHLQKICPCSDLSHQGEGLPGARAAFGGLIISVTISNKSFGLYLPLSKKRFTLSCEISSDISDNLLHPTCFGSNSKIECNVPDYIALLKVC
jgi:hypothetical protein